MFSSKHKQHKLSLEKRHNTKDWNSNNHISLRDLLTNTDHSLKNNLHYILYNPEIKWITLIFQHIKLFTIKNVQFVSINLNLQKLIKTTIPSTIEKLSDFIQINNSLVMVLSQFSPKNIFILFMLEVLKNVNTDVEFSNLDCVINFSTENLIEFFIYYIYFLCNKVYKNNTLQINYVFLDPGVCWLCLAVNQKYVYIEIIQNQIDSSELNDDDDNPKNVDIDQHLSSFLSTGHSVEITQELIKDLQLQSDDISSPMHKYNPISYTNQGIDSSTIIHEIPIQWYVLPTPVYGHLEDIQNSLPLIRMSFLLKLVMKGYLFKSKNMWMLDVRRNQLCPRKEFCSLSYNYISSMYLLCLNDKITDMFIATKITCNKSYAQRIIFALLCHCNMSDQLLNFLQINAGEWTEFLPFLDHSYLFDGCFNSITTDEHKEQDQYFIPLNDTLFSVNKSLTFNLYYHKKNVQNNQFFLVLLCVHRYTECALWMYSQLLQSGREENKQLAEKQLSLINKDYMCWLSLDCDIEPIKIEVILDLIQPVIQKGQSIIDQVLQLFKNGN
jgi:hypothetical protein